MRYKRYLDPTCRWIDQNKRSYFCHFPKNRILAPYCPQVRNTLKYVPDKDRKAFATDMKTIYQEPDEKNALAALDRVIEK